MSPRSAEPLTRRHLGHLAWAAAAGLLAGCAGLGWNTLACSVSSYGTWPQGRAPGRYFFEALPSQQSQPHRREGLEQAARPALEAAGFVPATRREEADVLVTLGARISALQPSPWRDPFWPTAVWGPRWPLSPWAAPGWQLPKSAQPEYEREVAVLLRDRASGEALFEARARSQGYNAGTTGLLGAMFSAALRDHPQARPEPHEVEVPLPASAP